MVKITNQLILPKTKEYPEKKLRVDKQNSKAGRLDQVSCENKLIDVEHIIEYNLYYIYKLD